MALSKFHAENESGYGSAVSSLLYSTHTTYLETKQGSYTYRGDAANFHEWAFRTKLKLMGCTCRNYSEVMSKIVDGLRGDTFIIATGIGLEVLGKPPTYRWSSSTAEGYDAEEEVLSWASQSRRQEATAVDAGIFADATDEDIDTEGGGDVLIREMRRSVFPLTQHEATNCFDKVRFC